MFNLICRVFRCALLLSLVGTFLMLSACGSNDTPGDEPTTPEELQQLTLPEGFSISYFSEGLTGARSLAVSDDGSVVFVGSRGSSVRILVDEDLDGVEDVRHSINGLNVPNGVAYHDGDLYVAEISRILRYPDILNNLENPGTPEVLVGTLPTEWHHGWKFIGVGPDNKLYIPVGAPCNVCIESDPRFASIMRMNLDGSDLEVYAEGIRNSVGFDWHPVTNELWFTENGADGMGNDQPACELNSAAEMGLHFGFPRWHQGDIRDPRYGGESLASDYVAPKFKFDPHSAPLGARFYTQDKFPENYRGSLFVAQHGSWDRTADAGHTGYKVKAIGIVGSSVANSEDFITGWLDRSKNQFWGRPVDVQPLPDGSLLISDDYNHCIYRVTYNQ